MIETHDSKTMNSYLFHLFWIGFTKKCNNQIQKTSYVQHQELHQIQKMMETMTRELQTNNLKEVVNKLIPDSIGKDIIKKACDSVDTLRGIFVRKVKMLKKLELELGKLVELHAKLVVLKKLLGVRQVLKLNKLMGMNHQDKILFKIHMFVGNK